MDLKQELLIGDRTLSIQTGTVAKQADGAALITYGATVLLVTACAETKPKPFVDFLPFTVDYRENTYAAGKIPGGFFKREGRPTEKEVLTCRLIDRPLRPLFDPGYSCETQVIGLVLSADLENDPDILAITGASAALYLSPIPFRSPVGAVRVGHLNNEFVINPTLTQTAESALNLVIVGTKDDVVMIEAGADNAKESMIFEAIRFGHGFIRQIIEAQERLFQQMGIEKRDVPKEEIDETHMEELKNQIREEIRRVLSIKVKKERAAAFKEIQDRLVEGIKEGDDEEIFLRKKAIDDVKKDLTRDIILKEKRRSDNRAFDEIRPLSCGVGFLPRTHGSALFTRGETQALVSSTLGTASDAQRVDVLEGESEKRFMLHYNFPPFSVGEVRFLRGPGRREIGHGALAERALLPMIPDLEEFPYTIRVVSDILESNGSSSMASVCGASLSLMDAGVPLSGAVAGIAMGLVKEGENYAILSDIAGEEDHYGDMDFKVAGSEEGITALQMDVKIPGVSFDIMEKGLEQARQGRLFILEAMKKTISEPRADISSYAPRIISIQIPTDKIRDVIGPGGKMIRSIIERTGVKIDIDDSGKVDIASVDEDSAKAALAIVEELVAEAEVGKTYLGKVQRLTDFGAFVEILPGTDGLLHISEIADFHVRDVRDELKEGDKILVKVIQIDDQNRVKLSRKAVLQDQKLTDGDAAEENMAARESREPREHRETRDYRDSRDSRSRRDSRGYRDSREGRNSRDHRKSSRRSSSGGRHSSSRDRWSGGRDRR